mmetsp:Transcript_18762/g.56468  ORF Transcript_18762/g.56468 Transcript_18762/m.56468 type:complete len:210 (-) Transcript_18762:827-1456(-)
MLCLLVLQEDAHCLGIWHALELLNCAFPQGTVLACLFGGFLLQVIVHLPGAHQIGQQHYVRRRPAQLCSLGLPFLRGLGRETALGSEAACPPRALVGSPGLRRPSGREEALDGAPDQVLTDSQEEVSGWYEGPRRLPGVTVHCCTRCRMVSGKQLQVARGIALLLSPLNNVPPQCRRQPADLPVRRRDCLLRPAREDVGDDAAPASRPI